LKTSDRRGAGLGGGSEEREVIEAILDVYEAMRTKDSERLISRHAKSGYSLFNDAPPYELLQDEDALHLKLSLMSQVQDLTYSVKEQGVEVLGDVVIVLYELEMSGLLVYQYRFEGSRWVRSARCTAVLKKEEGVWRIAHEHFSAPYPTRSSTL
jgi:ketosteroid isomerase-like protein